MNNLYDVIQEWDLDPKAEPKKNPKRGIEFRPDSELNYTPQSQDGKIRIATRDAVYYVRPHKLEAFLAKLKTREEALDLETSERITRWEALEESKVPVPELVKEKPKAPDYSDIKITHYLTKQLKITCLEMSDREILAYLQYYRKKSNRACVNVLKSQLSQRPGSGS